MQVIFVLKVFSSRLKWYSRYYFLCGILTELSLCCLTQVTAGQNLVFNSDCDRVPGSELVGMTIPQSIFDSVTVGAQITVLFTLYNSALLFPDDTDSSLRVNTSVIGATIDGVNTDSLTDNVTITFQLERNVSFCSEGMLTCLICELSLLSSSPTRANAFFMTVSIYFLQFDFYEFCILPLVSMGGWSTEGCTTIVNPTGIVTCLCDHLTNFALQIVSYYFLKVLIITTFLPNTCFLNCVLYPFNGHFTE